MEEREEFGKNFIHQTALTFLASVACLIVLAQLFGEDAKEVSTLFSLGSKGISSEVLLQYMAASVIMTLCRQIIFSDLIFKKMMTLGRTIIMILTVIIVMGIFIAVCGWFPINSTEGWIGFIVCFAICFILCTAFMTLKTKLLSKKYEKMLSEYRKDREE